MSLVIFYPFLKPGQGCETTVNSIVKAMVTKDNNGKAERTNSSIQEIKAIGKGYGTAELYRIAILFFYGDLDLILR